MLERAVSLPQISHVRRTGHHRLAPARAPLFAPPLTAYLMCPKCQGISACAANRGMVKVWSPLVVFVTRTLSGYLWEAHQVLGARRAVEWGLRHEPDSAELWALRGRVLLHTAQLGRTRPQDTVQLLEEARVSFARALERRPSDTEARREHGLALQNLAWLLGSSHHGVPPRDLLLTAVQEYSAVLERQPRRADVLHARATAQVGLCPGLSDAEALDRLRAARADLDQSLTLRPHAPEVVLHRAEVLGTMAGIHEHQGERSSALELRRAALADSAWALRLQPGWVPALLHQAIEASALAGAGDDPESNADLAITDATEVLRIQPRHVPATLVRAQARTTAACRFALQTDARAPLVWQQALGDYDAATQAINVRDHEEIVALRAQARVEWAEALERGNNNMEAHAALEEALAEYDQAVDDDPASVARLLGRAHVLNRLAEQDDDPQRRALLRHRALDDFTQVLALHPDHPAALAGRIQSLCSADADRETATQAMAMVEQAYAAQPNEPLLRTARRRALITFAVISEPGPERERALTAAEQECIAALEGDAMSADAHYDHARILFLQGQVTQAYAALEQAVHLAPGLRAVARRDPVWASVAEATGFHQLVSK